ncbi:hypothetical protein [Actinomadura harenae]|uniref:Uncharacterized protein n=1 Tax=Actinomadura harenae TaxID=2483351 RepID=A0A3M2M5V8_9ACTN|nr:hypothetical protein [Actinomadura harenae]RMI44951.1 hypothetical protein EBO15_11825 [Actinomadura harenae]
MDHRSRLRMRRRLRSLAWLELLNVPLQAVVWFGVIGLPLTMANVSGFALFVLLLLEGAGYWAAKVRQIAAPGSCLRGAGALAFARVGNVVVLAAGLPLIGWAVVAEPGAGSWPGLGFALLAALEHVNYFHVQLMYDTTADLRHLRAHGLRRAHLARDLALRARTTEQYRTHRAY